MDGNRKGRRIMRTLKIDEISAVDRPAQEGATVAITKRRPHDLVAALTAIHDDAPNAQKAEVAALIADVERELAKQDLEDDADLGALAGRMEAIAGGRMRDLIARVRESTGMGTEDAQRAAEASRIGSMLTAVTDLARDMTREVERARKSDGRPDPVAARDGADDELDRLAKARAERTGEDFYTAYGEVCGTDDGLALIKLRDGFHALAVGAAEHGRARAVSKAELDEEAAMRRTDLYGAAQAGADARAADGALLKRAREIQVERCDPRLSLVGALEIAKAERPGLAKAARI